LCTITVVDLYLRGLLEVVVCWHFWLFKMKSLV
jgi:hypothetical protein